MLLCDNRVELSSVQGAAVQKLIQGAAAMSRIEAINRVCIYRVFYCGAELGYVGIQGVYYATHRSANKSAYRVLQSAVNRLLERFN